MATPSTEEATPELYLDVMNVNLCGAVRCLKAVLPGMRERRSGAIVNITSIAGRMAAIAQSPYVASKFAFEGLSEGLAQELAPFGIRVVIIEPGVTKSAIFAKSIDAPNTTGAYDSAVPADVPVLRHRASPTRPTRSRSPRSSTTPSRPTSRSCATR